jgi:putative SOS response-associated peptidase YedK
MCGRFTIRTLASDIARQFGLLTVDELRPRYNVAPTQSVFAIREREAPAGRELVEFRWGLVPSWADDPSIGSKMINARSETVATKPAYREAYRQRRCLIPADGFYEWDGYGRNKQPFFIYLRNETPFAFAGLWETWSRGSLRMDTCTIITIAANDLLRPLHERMPVIVDPADYDAWLDPREHDHERLARLMQTYPDGEMRTRPVSRWVNSATHEGPECLAPPESRLLF